MKLYLRNKYFFYLFTKYILIFMYFTLIAIMFADNITATCPYPCLFNLI